MFIKDQAINYDTVSEAFSVGELNSNCDILSNMSYFSSQDSDDFFYSFCGC